MGSVWKESFAMVGLRAAAALVKGWIDFKTYSNKMAMSRFAYTTCEKTYGRTHEFDINIFLVKMQTLDDIITDFAPPVFERVTRLYYEKF